MTATEKDPLVASEAGYGAADKIEATAPVTAQPLLTRIKETLSLFWYLGFIAFGGPTAHVAILRDHLVGAKNFIEEDVFLELFALGMLQAPRRVQGSFHCGPTSLIHHSIGDLIRSFCFYHCHL